MKYQDIINSHIKYGISKDSIIENRGYKDILENVVIAPWWGHDMFNGKFDKIDKINDKVYNIYGSGFSFSFIELKRIGAPAIMDYILSLGLTDLYVPPLGDTPAKPLHAFLPLSVPSNVTFDTPGHQYPSGHATQVASLALKYLPASQL